jgi:hypothetical protein
VNHVGLERRGFAEADIKALRRAYRILADKTLNFSQAVEKIEASEDAAEPARPRTLVEFLKTTERGVIRPEPLALHALAAPGSRWNQATLHFSLLAAAVRPMSSFRITPGETVTGMTWSVCIMAGVGDIEASGARANRKSGVRTSTRKIQSASSRVKTCGRNRRWPSLKAGAQERDVSGGYQ